MYLTNAGFKCKWMQGPLKVYIFDPTIGNWLNLPFRYPSHKALYVIDQTFWKTSSSSGHCNQKPWLFGRKCVGMKKGIFAHFIKWSVGHSSALDQDREVEKVNTSLVYANQTYTFYLDYADQTYTFYILRTEIYSVIEADETLNTTLQISTWFPVLQSSCWWTTTHQVIH